ncbi:L-rhamnose isomerase [Salmonella enterica]|uniref:L-rhamnose isomerase n=1 Tax=Salmonella enterica TaxID=28901 RepID=UPI00398C24EA
MAQRESWTPGAKRLKLHAIAREASRPVARDEIQPEYCNNGAEWARAMRGGL